MDLLLHPTYFPSIASMACLAQHSVCWEVWDNYQKQTYRNRCYICTDQGRHILSIPIRHAGGSYGRQLYRDVKLDNDYPWQRLHWRSLQTAYRSSPFFEYFEEEMAPLFSTKFTFLMEFNFKTIEICCESLQIQMPANRSDEYKIKSPSMTDARYLVNAKQEHQFTQKPYRQVFQEKHGFVENLSVLDLLFNEGNSSITYLEDLDIDF